MMTSFISSQVSDTQPDIVTLLEEPNLLEACISHTQRRTKIKPHPLSEVPDLRIQQGLIIKDLLFTLLGIEGCYIRYSERFDNSDPSERIKGPDFKIAKHLDISLKSITKKIVKSGKYFSGLCSFIELYDKQEFGKAVQRLCYVISILIEKYQGVLHGIEMEFRYNANFNLSTVENILRNELLHQLGHLYEIVVAIHEENIARYTMKRQRDNDYFAAFLHNIQNDLRKTGSVDLSSDSMNFMYCKGGVVLKILQERIASYQGDAPSQHFLENLFDVVSSDYVGMLNSWLIVGEIDDPFEEFLIKKNSIPATLHGIIQSEAEDYWDDLFVIRSDGLIGQFLNKDIQNKILLTGKYLNLFRKCTGWCDFDALNESIQPISKLTSNDFQLKVEQLYYRANNLIIKLFFEGYHYAEFTRSLHKTFLFRDASKADLFLERAFFEMKRNKNAVSVSRLRKMYETINYADECNANILSGNNLSSSSKWSSSLTQSIQEFTIDSTNFYNLSNEILNVKTFDTEEALMHDSSNIRNFLNDALVNERVTSADSNRTTYSYDPYHSDEYTIASVNLDVKIPFPFNVVLKREVIFEYQLLFKLQMIVRYISKYLDNSWKEISFSAVWTFAGFDIKIKKWILRSRVLHNRMKDFINILQYYLSFDIAENYFNEFEETLRKIKTELKEKKLSCNVLSNGNDADGVMGTSSSLGFYNPDNIFDDQSSNYHFDTKRPDKSIVTLEDLTNRTEAYVSSMLSDSFITNKILLEMLKNILDIIFLYNNFLSSLKKTLVLLNITLFQEFTQSYPEKFEGKAMDDVLIQRRFGRIDETLNMHYRAFSNSLTDFTLALRTIGNSENQLLLILIERIENCFPVH